MEQLNFFKEPKVETEREQRAKLILQGVLQGMNIEVIKVTEENRKNIHKLWNLEVKQTSFFITKFQKPPNPIPHYKPYSLGKREQKIRVP